MLIKVKTLTGKEIEIDIEPTDKLRLESCLILALQYLLRFLLRLLDRIKSIKDDVALKNAVIETDFLN
ncbi:NEDD8-like protein [Mya arenaria]|uniref:NEDD8-like protein n=1 Tax=Mya arenaria TaxID=6604 RepID=A0ABY7ESN4_MYAAR|nr:NEDD8-like protein [Mya arenaria]